MSFMITRPGAVCAGCVSLGQSLVSWSHDMHQSNTMGLIPILEATVPLSIAFSEPGSQ